VWNFQCEKAFGSLQQQVAGGFFAKKNMLRTASRLYHRKIALYTSANWLNLP
jgi:hypothetical protein